MLARPTSNLVTVNWLKHHLQQKELCLLFTHMPNFFAAHPSLSHRFIPNSLLFDFEDRFCDKKNALAHTMPNAKLFTQEAQKLGINSNSIIVIYDPVGLVVAPRVWWMFKAMGHKNVYVLNGGLPAWVENSFSTTDSLGTAQSKGDFSAKYAKACFIHKDEIRANLNQLNILDARSAGRFNGTEKEPRAGLRAGHMPNAKNCHYAQCLDNGYLKPTAQLKDLFNNLFLKPNQPLVMTCGSGVTACILALAASELGYDSIRVYDGSWAEWGANSEMPIEV